MNKALYPALDTVYWPLEPYRVTGHKFGDRVRSRMILWARHLGDDLVVPKDTPVHVIGSGRVVFARRVTNATGRRSWGGLIVVEHTDVSGTTFFSLYGHVYRVQVQVGDVVAAGQVIAAVAPGETKDNGGWKKAHLHFGIYAGPWVDQVLPGYARIFDGRTRFRWWRNPHQFLREYKAASLADRDSIANASL